MVDNRILYQLKLQNIHNSFPLNGISKYLYATLHLSGHGRNGSLMVHFYNFLVMECLVLLHLNTFEGRVFLRSTRNFMAAMNVETKTGKTSH